MTEQLSNSNQDSNNISVKEILFQLNFWFKYLLNQWWKFVIIGFLGGAFGFAIAYTYPITYTSKLSFIVEDSKNSGGLASLAGLAGIEIGGMTSGNGLLSGDNILLFLKSESLIRTTLLTSYNSSQNYSLADKYADVYELREKWKKIKKINQLVYFPCEKNKNLTRLQDSLLQVLAQKIILKELSVVRPEKRATFINVTTTMKNEILAKLFCERLVNEACVRYVYSKIKRQKLNVDRLQQRADSLGRLLNNKTFTSANENEKLLDINPALKTQSVAAEVLGRDKFMLTTIFGEVIKNLEIAKIQLNQETPTIYMVDGSDLFLKANKLSKFLFAILGSLLTSIVGLIYFILKKVLE